MLQIKPEQDSGSETETFSPEDDRILCARCQAEITRRCWQVVRGGQLSHMFLNPAGHAFEVICFSQAQGVQPVGAAILEATWFSGYTWRVSVCAHCSQHIGWLYEAVSGTDAFFGLIRPRLLFSAAA